MSVHQNSRAVAYIVSHELVKVSQALLSDKINDIQPEPFLSLDFITASSQQKSFFPGSRPHQCISSFLTSKSARPKSASSL